MRVCPSAKEAVDNARLARLREDGDALDGHALLARLKVAAALAILDGRADVTVEDWHLAGVVQGVSDITRRVAVDAIAARQRQTNHAHAAAEGERSVIVAETVDNAAVTRVAHALGRRVGPEWVTGRDLRNTLNSRDRQWFDDAVERLVDAGQVEAVDTDNPGPRGRRYRACA
jgi:hypothetical protein